MSADCDGHVAAWPMPSSPSVANACHGFVTPANRAVATPSTSSAPTSTRHGPTRSLSQPMNGTVSSPAMPRTAMALAAVPTASPRASVR